MPSAIKKLFICAILFILSQPAYGADINSPDDKASAVPGYSMGAIRSLVEAVERTGLGFDSIQAIDNPSYMSVSDASLSMDDDEIVFIVEFPEGITRIYPQRIMVWHEIVNDVLPDPQGELSGLYTGGEDSDRRYTISYSPLSGAVVAFRSLAGRFPSNFGSAGDLINANSVLYDRVSHSLWSQLLGVAFDGPLTGRRFERLQVIWATWKGVKTRYMGKAEVLSRPTMQRRPYGKDPYGSYQRLGNYYDDARVINKLSTLDRRLHPKQQVLGIEHESLFGAVQKDLVKEERVLNFTMGITPMVAVYDQELDSVRVFDRRLGGKRTARPLEFMIFEDRLTDKESKSHWNVEGLCTYGRYGDQKLLPIYSIDTMWMSWAAFHRNSPIFP